MKKFLAILFALALIAMLPLTTFAATGLNEHEKEVLGVLKSAVDLGSKGEYKIPQEYINAAETYFKGDCDMTEEEADAILALIGTGAEIIEEESAKVSGGTFNLSKLPQAAREEILTLGQEACEKVDLDLVYEGNKVVITEEGSKTPVFKNSAVIKTTGQAVTIDASFVCIATVLCLALATGVMFVVSKRNGLLEK